MLKKCTELSEMYESHITQKLCSAEIAKWALMGSLMQKGIDLEQKVKKVEKTEKLSKNSKNLKVAHSFAALK